MDPRETATAAALADPAGFSSFVRKNPTTRARVMTRTFTVETPNGTVDGQPGDYLALDDLDQPYVISNDVFNATFDRVPVTVGL
jgi:hypothetical protein